jgi:hypothetical protein
MDPQYIQNLRYKLQKRISRLNGVDTADSFIFTLVQFWKFFDRHPTFTGIMQELLSKYPNINNDIDRVFNGEGLYGETEEEAAALGYGVLRKLTREKLSDVGFAYGRSSSDHPAKDAIREIHLDPFYNTFAKNDLKK